MSSDANDFRTPRLRTGKRAIDGRDVEILDAKPAFHEASPYPFPAPHKPFFAIDAYRLTHSRFDGGTMEPIVREVMERRDAVGVFLYNRDTDSVIVVEQFRLPTLETTHKDGSVANGWLVETIAGIVKDGEPPEVTAIRETEEESGYRIANPELIAEFYSSPGGTSEKIYLYFKEVSNTDKKSSGGGDNTEDILVKEMKLGELRELIKTGKILDPKLLIATYSLQTRLGFKIDTATVLDDGEDPTVYVWKHDPTCEVRIKTGDILEVRDVDIWLNPENKYLMMARIIDEGLSASIRWGGAQKYRSGIVAVDTIGNELRLKMQGRVEAGHMEIVETEPGDLQANGVRRLIHLPVLEARGKYKAREGMQVDRAHVGQIVKLALDHANGGQSFLANLTRRIRELAMGYKQEASSVLIPLIGTGEGRLSVHDSVREILKGVDEFWQDQKARNPGTPIRLRKVYLLAYYDRTLESCKIELTESHAFEEAAPGKNPGR